MVSTFNKHRIVCITILDRPIIVYILYNLLYVQ